jgi:hypothetical protein
LPTIDEVAQSVHETLAQEWGVESGKDGTDSVAFGSTWCHVSCSPHGDCEVHGNDSVIVCLAAPVLFNVPITDELCRWVATDGDYLFGRVKVHPDDTGSVGTVALEHAILGDHLDAEELVWAVSAIGLTADRLDDELQALFGGQRSLDM